MIDDTVLSPTQFVEGFNMLIGYSLPTVVIEGELSELRISKNRWLYFNIADEQSSVACFGTVYMLKQPVENGMVVRIQAVPKLHNRFGFSLNLVSIMPVGEGSIRRSAELLRAKLEKEGLFAPERKRTLPYAPSVVGLITSDNSAAYHDFLKITNERWGGVEILFSDVLVQGESSPVSIVRAIETQNQLLKPPEVIVIIRGGGSAEDLQAFNDELVVRAVALSRVPTMLAIGHEIDISLAELAADKRSSTPTSAANQLFPDKKEEIRKLQSKYQLLVESSVGRIKAAERESAGVRSHLSALVRHLFAGEESKLSKYSAIAEALNPNNVLKRGYSVLRLGGISVRSVKVVSPGQTLIAELSDGTIETKIENVKIIGETTHGA